MSDYQFQYLPLTGKLSGKQMIEQTEQTINELAQIVNEGSAQVEVITNLANTANNNAEEALEKAQQALDTTGRVYINESSAVDIDDYYDSQLLYIEDSTSTHLPVADSGFLDVKTNDTKTACEQLFTADTDGQLYFRSGVITASTVGDVIVYSVEYSDWASYSTSAYVQAELEDYAELTDLEDYVTLSDLSTELGNYLPLAGGMMTGAITRSGGGDVVLNNANTSWTRFSGGTAYNDGGHIILYGKDNSSGYGKFTIGASNGTTSKSLIGHPDGTLTWGGTSISLNGHTHSYLPLSGGTMTGEIKRSGGFVSNTGDSSFIQLNGGSGGANGAYLILYGKNHSSYAGRITLRTGDGANNPALALLPNGTATWNGDSLLTDATVGIYKSSDASSVSLASATAKNITSISLAAGRWLVIGSAYFSSVTANKIYGIQVGTTSGGYGYANSGSVAHHSVSTGAMSIQTTHVFNLSATTTVYLTGYSTAASTVNSAVMQAIRIV